MKESDMILNILASERLDFALDKVLFESESYRIANETALKAVNRAILLDQSKEIITAIDKVASLSSCIGVINGEVAYLQGLRAAKEALNIFFVQDGGAEIEEELLEGNKELQLEKEALENALLLAHSKELKNAIHEVVSAYTGVREEYRRGAYQLGYEDGIKLITEIAEL